MQHISEITPVIAGIIRARSLQQYAGTHHFCPWCARYLNNQDYSCPHCELIL